MEVKLLELTADDGHIYKAVGFRESDDVQALIDEAGAEGKAEGKAEAEAECAEKHYVGSFVGDGTNTATFNIPFKPDIVVISALHPGAYGTNYAYASMWFDLKSFGWIVGVVHAHKSENNRISSLQKTGASAHACFSWAEDGTVTLNAPATDGFFIDGATYYVSAVKYTDKTDKEFLDDYINSLEGTGTARLSAARVDSVYQNASAGTSEDWNALTAAKSGWTFTLA